jgi:cation diffusion facilitator CzcD-associated flavoprotein CzcO
MARRYPDGAEGAFRTRAKRVAVVGTGATAVQAIPQISQQAKQLTVFQHRQLPPRTPSGAVQSLPQR